ncbi:MAG: S41 family peptidase, partial [Myxococcota bacterium]
MMTSRLLRLGLAPALGLAVAYVAFAGPRRDVAAVSANDVTVGSGTLLPPNHEREVARLVADHLEHFHYTDRPIDDTLSRQWFDAFLDRLDYQRTVFLAEDIASFEAYRESFDDIVDQRRPDLSAPVRMYTVLRQRLRSRLAYAQKLLNKGVNVKDRETFVADRHEADAAWPANEREANELWRKRLEDEFIGEMLGGDAEDEVLDRLKKRYETWERVLDQEESADLVESWLGALTRTYDPHSEWFKPAKNDDFDIDITNSVTGIGASLRNEEGETTIVDLIAGGPAEKDGRLGPEDVILAVGQGKRGEMVDVVGWRIDKVVRLIRGEVKTRVRLLVEHPDKGREEITIIRELVTLEDSAAEHRLEEVRGRKLGVVELPSFYVAPDGSRRRASTDVRDALVELNQQGAEGLVLDLRSNGGGSLLEAIDVTGLFITTGPVVQVRTRPGRIEALHDRNPQVSWVKDMVVLIDETSASASEIVAGALQDYGRALVVGAEQTHGKGTVQQVLQLTNRLSGKHAEPVGGALKLTIQKFYRVSGSSTQNRGVVSDVVLPSRWQGVGRQRAAQRRQA